MNAGSPPTSAVRPTEAVRYRGLDAAFHGALLAYCCTQTIRRFKVGVNDIITPTNLLHASSTVLLPWRRSRTRPRCTWWIPLNMTRREFSKLRALFFFLKIGTSVLIPCRQQSPLFLALLGQPSTVHRLPPYMPDIVMKAAPIVDPSNTTTHAMAYAKTAIHDVACAVFKTTETRGFHWILRTS